MTAAGRISANRVARARRRALAPLLCAAALCLLVTAHPTQAGEVEILRLRVVNDCGGPISASCDGGQTWTPVGQVLRYTTQVNRDGFTASKWIAPGRVVATAVNAIHINVGVNPENDRGIVFSLLPREFATPPSVYGSFLSPDSSIQTDMPAGSGIFGGGYAPMVGSPVYLERDGGLIQLEPGYVPARGDVLVIVVDRPRRYPISAVFENREGGEVTLCYPDGSRQLIGWVVRPVRGIGRFAGSVYASVGRIRADHPGVIDISTSPIGDLGGFQIIPFRHALSPEMAMAWTMTQWMVVGPAWQDPALGPGLLPLMYGYIRPDFVPDDLYAPDWQARLLSRFLVDVETDEWRPMLLARLPADPTAPLPEWANTALSSVKCVRILFPLAERGCPQPASGD